MSRLHRVGTIKTIFRYPVKSMGGEELTLADLQWHGIEGDRRYAFVRTGDMSGMPWLTACKMPELIRYRARQNDKSVHVRLPDGTDVAVESEALYRHVAANYGAEVTLIRVRNGIFDDAPISIISTTTISTVEKESERALDPRRFRPNLLIEPGDEGSLDESTWIGKTVFLGDRADSPSVRITAHDIRCTMVDLDPETAAADPRVFRSIVRSRDNCAGVYGYVLKVGRLAAGDGVHLMED